MKNKRGQFFLAKNRKGQGLSTSTIILLILGVIILVVLALGFTIGWSKLLPFIPSNNVETIKTTCASACTTENAYGFCTQIRTLKADDLPGGVKKVSGTCEFFSTDAYYEDYGIEPCPDLCD